MLEDRCTEVVQRELQAIEIRNVINARQPLVNGISQNRMNRSTLCSGKGAIQ
jgi:hypothetical protein